MKPIYKSIALAALTLQVSVALQAQTYDGESAKQVTLDAELLQSLKVELVAPNVSGTKDLVKSGECVISGANLTITLGTANWLKGGTYRVQVSATFGTQTQVIYALDVTVPYYAALSESTQEEAQTLTVVSTISNAGESTVVDEELSLESENPVQNKAVTAALNGKADASETELALAGKADGSVYAVEEQGDPAVRDVAAIRGSMMQFSTGATPKFAIDQSGNLVLYDNGTPVILTPAKLAQLIA